MNLKEFVSEALTEIMAGVTEAKSSMGEGSENINPMPYGGADTLTRQGTFKTTKHMIGTFVEFDIAVTLSEGGEASGGIGIFSGVFNVGTAAKTAESNVELSRIKFQVPIALP